MFFLKSRRPDIAGAIENLEAMPTWQGLRHVFYSATRDEYMERVVGQCKSLVSRLYQESSDKKLFIPAHPAGTEHVEAFHCYGLAGPRLSQDAEQDIVFDPSIGQIVTAWAPYIGERGKLRDHLKRAFADNAINPAFLRYFSKRMATEGKPATAETLFDAYYGQNSWNAFNNKNVARYG